MLIFSSKKLVAPKFLIETQMILQTVPDTKSSLMEMEASVWLLPPTDIHHLKWFSFSDLTQLTTQMRAQQSQTADSFPFRHAGGIDTYW